MKSGDRGNGKQSPLLTAKNGHRSTTQTPRKKNAKKNTGRKHLRKGRRR